MLPALCSLQELASPRVRGGMGGQSLPSQGSRTGQNTQNMQNKKAELMQRPLLHFDYCCLQWSCHVTLPLRVCKRSTCFASLGTTRMKNLAHLRDTKCYLIVQRIFSWLFVRLCIISSILWSIQFLFSQLLVLRLLPLGWEQCLLSRMCRCWY